MGRRFRTSLLLQLREYRARLIPLVMLALLPIGFWAATYFSLPPDAAPVPGDVLEPYTATVGPLVTADVPERDTWPMDTAFMGVGWGLAAAALFSVIGSAARDRRLILAGYHAWEIVLARFLILLGISVLVAVAPVALVVGFSSVPPPNVGLVWLGAFFAAVVGAGIGLIIGSLLPRQLEGTILLIGIIGVEVSLPLSLPVRHYLPLYGPQALFLAGRLAAHPDILGQVLRALVWTGGLFASAVALWTWRVRVYRPAPSTASAVSQQARLRSS
jgi:hypothetical protein